MINILFEGNSVAEKSFKIAHWKAKILILVYDSTNR